VKETIAKLKIENEELKSENNFLREKCENTENAYNQLLFNFKQFQRQLFGNKSERYLGDQQPDLFTDDLEETVDEDDDDEEELVVIRKKKRSKNNKPKFPPGLSRREVIIPADDDTCACGAKKKLLRYEITELLNYIPPVYEVIVQKREILVCAQGCDGSISIAANPPRVLPKVPATETVIANMIVSKLDDRQPLYHQEQQLSRRLGLDLSRDKLARWFIDSSKALQPLINLMKDQVIDYDVASADATSIQVLDEPNRLAQQKSYWYCIRGGPPKQKVILYDYNAQEHKQFLVDWFDGFKGYLHVDAQNIFDDLGEQENVWLVYCNSHSRRKFEPIAKSAKSDGLAKQALRTYRKLFKIEKEAKDMEPAQRCIYRLNNSKPILDEYKQWLENNYPKVLAKSPLGKAIAYNINHWPGLYRYLEDGRLEFDNNGTEREIKPGVIARKNFLFAYSVPGVNALCVHMSLIRTAILHGLDPYNYYVAVLKALPFCKTVEDYEALLPWNIMLQKQSQAKIAVAA
jgi:transposase